MKLIRRLRQPIASLLTLLMAVWQVVPHASAAPTTWTAGSGADLLWSNTINWDTGLAPTAGDDVIFLSPIPNPGILPNPNVITLGAGSLANTLSFRDRYTLAGGDLTLTNGGVRVNVGVDARVDSILAGSMGLTLTGGGALRLTNVGNSYTGATSIRNGSLTINSEAALGGTGAVSILSTNTTPSNVNLIGFGGGSLVLDGTAGGFALARDIDFEGRGPIGDRGAAIQSLGNNTLSGVLTSAVSPLTPATVRNSRINSVNGTLTISGTLNVGGTLGTTITSLGGVNTAGVGNFSFAGGTIAGTGTLEKSGSGALFLDSAASVSGFTGAIRTAASSIGQQSSIRVTQATVGGTSVFGASTASGITAPIDLNGGVLEFRSNSNLDFNALTTGKNVYLRASTVVYTGPAGGGDTVNGQTTLGLFRVAQGQTATFRSRNGFGTTLQAWTQESSNGNTAIANEMGGTLTFTGDAWNNADGSARNLTFSGNGNTRIVGNITATGTNKQLIKQGTGELILNGTAGTFTGATSIQGGAVRITDFRSINNNTVAINLGNATTTAGALIIGGTGVGTATAAGLTTSKPIVFNNTTAQSSIYANQAGVNPVILNGTITTITTTGNYNLGGSNTADNIINTALPAGTTGGLTKVGAGTWVLNAANLYAGATTIQAGTLKLRANAAASNVIPQAASNTIVFNSQATAQTAGGTLEFRGFSGAATTEALGALTPTSGAATVRLLGNGAAANLSFTSLGATTAASSVNFDTSLAAGGVITLTGQAATTATNLPGTANFQGHLYINGANFATIGAAGLVQAPAYGAAGNFRDAGPALVAATHNRLTAATASSAATISSLLSNNQTLTLSGDLVISTGGILQSGGTASIVSDDATPRLIQGAAAATNVAIRVNQLADVLNLGNATNPVILSSVVTGGLTKNGAGELVVFGANAQAGTTTINEGTIELNGTSARLAAAAGTATVVRQNAFLEFNTAAAFAANPTVAALDGAGTIRNVGAADVTFIQTGAGTWAGSFSQTGSGVLNVSKLGTTEAPFWSGLSNYTGVTTIGGTTGLVTVDFLADGGQNSGIGASTSAASNLVFSGTSSGLDYRGNIIDTALTLGSRSAKTDRLFTLAAAATGATLSSTVSNNNAIVWSNTGTIVNNTTANATLTLAGSSAGDNTFKPQLIDSSVGGGVTLAVTKSGAGQWNLGNTNNTYTGATTVADGVLGLNENGALPSGSPLVLGSTTSSGILQASGTFARNLTTTPTAGTGTITWGGTTGGGGLAAHSTTLTVTLDGGTGLTWGSGGFVGTGGVQSLILNSGTSLANVIFTNAIDLGTAARMVTVNDNPNTGADYADLTGVLSGAGGGLFKNGAGILRVGNANTYTGITSVDAGTLVASSLGSSTSGGTSSVGAGGVTMDDTNAIVLGNATTTGGNLQYVGPGETSDRKIRLRGTSANSAIYADGAGPLVLTNVAHDTTESGNKTLSLRGTNAAGNMITSPLSNNGTGVLSVTVDGGATWILSNSGNNYTGATTAGAGALGIGDDMALGTGTLVFSNGNVFAHGADRTVANPITHNNNTNAGFFGDYSLTFNAPLNLAAAANNANTTTNNIVAGKVLTFAGGVTANVLEANRAWAIDGTGETVINGNFTTTTGFGVRFDINGGGTLTLGTDGTNSNFNQSILVADVDRGTLKFSANNAIPTTFTAAASPTTAGTAIAATTYTVASTAGLLVGQTFSGTNVPAGSRIVSIDSPTTFTTNAAPTTAVASGVSLTFAGSGGVTLTPELANTDIARIDLNGTTQTIPAFTAATDGEVIIDNTAATAATLRFGANNTAVSITNAGARTVTDSGAGALSIEKTGNTALTLPTGMTLTYQGSTISTGGGSFTINSALNGTTGLIATGSSTLALVGGLTAPGDITSVSVGNGSTLSLLDGTGSKIDALTSLTLGTASGTNTFLNLNVGDTPTPGDGLNTDTLALAIGGALNLFAGNKVTFNLTDTGLNANQSYTLLDATAIGGGFLAGPLVLADYVLGGTPGGFTTISLSTSTNNQIILTTGNLITGSSYFTGLVNNAWNGSANNWADDKAGTIPSTSIPGQGTDVIFRADNAVTPTLATTLEQNFKINSLTFEASTTPANTPTSISIAPGAVATNRLELAPQLPTAGLNVPAGGTPLVTISSPVRATSNQTWSVADAATLTGATYATASTTVNVASTTGLRVGMTVAGPGIPAGATVVSISAGSFVISAPTTAAADTAVTVNATSLVSVTGVLTGSGSITKAGAGAVVWAADNPLYSGMITVSAGSLSIGNGGATGSIGSGDIVNNGQLIYNRTGTFSVPNLITGTGAVIKQGADTMRLGNAANSFAGPLTVSAGTLAFASIGNVGAGATALGAPTTIAEGTISLAGTLNFTGGTSQSTDRLISLTGGGTLTASGTGGATISYTGAIAGGASSLTLDGTGEGFLNGVITQTGTTADLTKNGAGTWTLNATNTLADDILVNAGTLNINVTQAPGDDIVITGLGTIVNINAVNAHQGDDLFIRNGAVVNLGVNGALGAGMDDLNIAENAPAPATATLDLKGFTSTVDAVTIGFENSATGQIVSSAGNGVLTAASYTVRQGLVAPSVRLAGAGGVTKNGAGVFTLSGINTFTGASVVTEGQLVLDYSTNNTSKIAAAAGLTIGGAAADENPTLTINGNSSAATTQAFTVLTLSQASGNLVVTSNGGQAANLNFTTISRNIGATLDLTLPAVGSVTTTQPLTNGIVGGYFTLGNGASFATKDGSNAIQPLVPTTKNDVTTWALADNVTDGGTGFTGTATGVTGVNSLTYSGVAASVNSTGVIGLNSGGILVTSTSTGSSLTGGVLTSGLFDVVVHQYAAGDFTLSSAIRGANAITKTGSGALVLSGTNTANGAVNITEGLVTVSGGNAIGDTSAVGLKDVAGVGLQLLANETVGNISGGGPMGGTIALGNNTLTTNATANTTYAGLITGGAGTALVRNGSSGVGNLLLSGASGAGFTGTVTVNGGLVYLEGLGSMDASSITVNKGGSFLISNNGTTRSATRLPDTASIILNSADGAWNTETRPSGLAVRTDQNGTTSETVGVLSFASGASYFRGDASGTTGVAGILASNFTRANNATLDARGRALGGSTGDRNQLRISDATNQTAFISTLVGGGGAAGTKNVSIVPWMFGESTSAGLADANMGNSLVTYVSGAGVRPLDLATEYNTFGGTPLATDNIRESLALDLTGLAGTTINSLVVNNSNTASGSVNVVGTGAGQTLAVTSGTMLFTATAAVTGTPSMGLSLGGFDAGITVGGTNEYVVFVQNPTSAAAGGTVTATISSPLTSTSDITKSGRGVLVLSGTNTAGGATKKTTINEGTLEISSLANIGGATGNLVFAGGTLRLGTTLTDDISTRAISFLQGGGSIDTNGINLTLANSIGGGSIGSFTKTGAGNLTVNAAMIHTGGTIVANGTLAAGIANMVPVTSNLTVNGAAAILDLGTFNQAVSSFTLGNGTVNGTATVTASDYQLQAGTLSGAVVLAGANASVGITKTTAGTVALSGAHTFTGPVVIQAGFLSVDQIADANGTPSSLGAQANPIDGALQIGLGANAAGITYTGSGQTANRQIALTGTTGSATIAASGTGALDWAGAVTSVEFGTKTLVLRGTSAPAIVNKLSAGITETLGSVGIQKLDSNVWQIDTASNYTGPTQIDEGTLKIGITNALPATTAVRLGSGTTAGVLDLNGFDQTIGSLSVQTNSNTVTNQILVGAGKTLTINGAVTLGIDANAADTNISASGGGAIVVNSGGANFIVGAATGATNDSRVDADFSGLSSLTANLGAGTFRLGDVNTGTEANPSTFKLAVNNNITASAIRVGDGVGGSTTHVLTLGSGTNTLNTDTLNVGSAGATVRSSGTVVFDVADTTGTVQVRASDGTGRSTINMVNTTGNTGGDIGSTVNLAGHTADIRASTLTMATRTTGSGAATAALTFDQGTLDVTTLNMASRTGAGNGSATSTVTLGDSAAPGSPTTTIGTVNMAVNTSAGGTVTSNMVITGGTVNIGTGTGTAINMANAAASRTAVSTINLTGGTLSVTGNIARTGGAGTETATITVNGGSLNMNGNSIGTAGAPITLQAQSGTNTITGLAQLNGGGLLTKSTTGALSMGDGNTYTGGTLVSDGTLLATNSTGSATGSGAVNVAAAGTLGGTGSIIAGSNNNITIAGTLDAGLPAASSGTALALTVGGTGALAMNGSTLFQLFTGGGTGTPNGNTAADQVVVNAPNWSNIVFGGASTLTITTGLTATSFVAGDSWKIFDWVGVAAGSAPVQGTNGFNSVVAPTLDPGFTWDYSSLFSAGTISVIVVPEPSRALLLMLSLLGLMIRRRRK